MGEPNFSTTLSETSSEKRRLYFEPVASREVFSERHSTLGKGFILLLLSRWVVERPRSNFSPAGRLFEPKKFTERVLRTTVAVMMSHCSAEILLGAVDGAPSTCCAKHSSVIFFEFFQRRIPCAKNCRETFRRPPEPSRGLPEAFGSFFGKNKKFYFSIIFHESST